MVSWRSKKKSVVARSSAKVEFRAMALALCEILWLRIVLDDLRFSIQDTVKLWCDNQSAINIAHNLIQHDRTKHVEIDRHFIKEKLEAGVIHLPYVPSEEQVADILTKGLPVKRFEDLVSKLEMWDIHSPT